ncbi:hypothetical protein RFI_17195 [Reticulomyxa filosa]|uniref:Cyclin-dependent kinase 2 homolog n=1 Tax=Reticulomyxa filosa TaxID=46433 RepID=X6N1T1_RETFI|nr:hypothetical protein RFI_17195 [Reticulomyxa filosa]|eukprot:ETO20021.1 hypothetical protein RFI_17195 [Reticulomyxa filosa]
MKKNSCQTFFELQKICNHQEGMAGRYQKIEKLGEGTCGNTFKARDKENGSMVALKRFRTEEEEGVPSTAIHEISLLKELQHDNIIKLLNVFMGKSKLMVIYELLDQNLNWYMDSHNNKGLSIAQCKCKLLKYIVCLNVYWLKSFLYQLCDGVQYCHGKNIFHRDLKPQNLRISKEGKLKICKFTSARILGVPVQNLEKQMMTLWYRAPDVLAGSKHYDLSADMWSVGCIFAEMLIGKALFPGISEKNQLIRIFQLLGTPKAESWFDMDNQLQQAGIDVPKFEAQALEKKFPMLDKNGINLLQACLEYNPKQRISAKEVMNHPFLKKSEEDLVKEKPTL